jgi:hypothetical protein
MSSDPPPQSARVVVLLEQLDGDRRAMLKLWLEMSGGKDAPIFPLDFVAFGAVKRNLSLASAIRGMVESWNMVCARALLRLHIDTSLRFAAAWMVDDPHNFASKILKGERIDLMKDRDGKKLTDTYLVKTYAADYPWLPAVYSHLSGYVHFSGSHIYDSIVRLDDDTQSIHFEITDTDLKFPESSWIEILDCFRDATKMLAKFLHGYMITKQMSPSELDAARHRAQPPAQAER